MTFGFPNNYFISRNLTIHTHIHYWPFLCPKCVKHSRSSTGFYFKSKNCGKLSWNGQFFSKCTFLMFQHFFPFAIIQSTHFPPFNRWYYDWECVFFLFPWQPLLKKPIFSPQLCRLSVQNVPVKIGVKQIDYSRKSVAKVYLLPYYEWL